MIGGGEVGAAASAELAPTSAITAAATTLAKVPMSICKRRRNLVEGAVDERR